MDSVPLEKFLCQLRVDKAVWSSVGEEGEGVDNDNDKNNDGLFTLTDLVADCIRPSSSSSSSGGHHDAAAAAAAADHDDAFNDCFCCTSCCARKIQIQDLRLWSQLSPRDQIVGNDDSKTPVNLACLY
jgi:hypothetical protein